LQVNAQVYDQYRKTTVETMSPAKLLLMLYDGALKNLRTAQKAIAAKDLSRAHNELIKAQDIVTELMATLNMDIPISQQLYALYDYIQRRLIEANLNKDPSIIDEAYQFINELRDAFAQAAQETGRPQVQTRTQNLNIMG